MTKRNWKEETRLWLEAGRPGMTEWSRQRKIPIGTLRKQAVRHGWAEKGKLMDTRTQEALVEFEAQKAVKFRERMIKIGQALQAKGIGSLQVTGENALHAIRLGAKLEEVGVYGPRAQTADGPVVAIQQNTQIFTEAINVAQGPDGKESAALARALEELLPRRTKEGGG